MKKTYTVTIGIPAHNEGNNIKKVLSSILDQQQEGWKLETIAVYCDGCTDKTAENARSVTKRQITVIDDGKRLGKTTRLQQMFNALSSDILLMLDADIKLYNKQVITHLVEAFAKDEKVMLVGGNSRPFSPRTFFENAVYSTFQVFYRSRRHFKHGNNVFGCTGSILAIRKTFSDQIIFPNIINEDAYLYMACISNKYKFRYVDKAIVEYKLPNNISDYVKQVFRSEPISVVYELEKYFGKRAEREFHRPIRFYVSAVLSVFFTNPLGVISIIVINLLCRPLIPFILKNYKLEWFTAHSTKYQQANH